MNGKRRGGAGGERREGATGDRRGGFVRWLEGVRAGEIAGGPL